MAITGRPEKESTLRILDMQVKSSEIEDRSPLDAMRWQYYLTSGVVLKAPNEEYELYTVLSALNSLRLFVNFIKPHFADIRYVSFFKSADTMITEHIRNLAKSDKGLTMKANIIIYCEDILNEVNSMIVTDFGEVVVGSATGVL